MHYKGKTEVKGSTKTWICGGQCIYINLAVLENISKTQLQTQEILCSSGEMHFKQLKALTLSYHPLCYLLSETAELQQYRLLTDCLYFEYSNFMGKKSMQQDLFPCLIALMKWERHRAAWKYLFETVASARGNPLPQADWRQEALQSSLLTLLRQLILRPDQRVL